ncbi:MAG: alpha/beta fold hydrolase, partial [Acidimicrobiia bacterium]|nr:alpha/beta fold hydrolase [Acidimicrobiia bacterium]
RLTVPAETGGPAVLLAHGAGAGQGHPFMAGLRERLAAAGHPTLTFDYPYMEAGRRAPDRMPTLLACHRAALARLRSYGWPVVLAGRSMGGRMASHLAAEESGVTALVVFGYPLVSPSTGEMRPTDHLSRTGMPMLFLSGSRDRLGPLDALRPLVAGLPDASLEVIEEGDHSFKVPMRTGLSPEDVLDRLAALTVEWLRTR